MPADSLLVQIIDDAVEAAIARAPGRIACRRGCTHCCIGPFAVTGQDLDRLRQGLAEAPAELRTRIESRAHEARLALQEGFPGDWTAGLLTSLEAADQFDLAHPWLPCPILDLETGACSLHTHRPIACRLHGPALRLNGLDLRPCRLNYPGTDPEPFRVTVDTPAAPPSPLTYIAWVTAPATPSFPSPPTSR